MPKSYNKVLGEKLKKVREKLGMTLDGVSKKMDFKSYQILSAIEDGKRMVKAAELAKLAKIYLRDIEYFLNEDVQEDQEQPVLWRAYAGKDESKLKENEFLKFCQHYYSLEYKLNIDSGPKVSFLNWKTDDFDFNSIESLANDMHNKLQLGSRPACSLAKILEEKCNIKILFLDLENHGSAASSVGKFGAAILINASEPSWRRNYDLAHELFHIITWHIFKHEDVHFSSDEKPLIEKWADAFASYLLLPSNEIREEFHKIIENKQVSLLDLIGLAREFEISLDALLWRLVTLKYLQRTKVLKILDDPETKAIDSIKRTKNGSKKPPYLSRRYFNFAVKAYKKALISKGRLCEYLDINRADLDMVLNEQGYSLEEELYETKFAVT